MKKGTEPASETSCIFLKNLGDGQSPPPQKKKGDYVSESCTIVKALRFWTTTQFLSRVPDYFLMYVLCLSGCKAGFFFFEENVVDTSLCAGYAIGN